MKEHIKDRNLEDKELNADNTYSVHFDWIISAWPLSLLFINFL